jgi:hypothetical protein
MENLSLRRESVEIQSTDFGFTVTGMLQQNWALIDELTVYFISDTGGLFDQMEFDSIEGAKTALTRNDFGRYADNQKAQQFILPPEPPFVPRAHPNGAIYSSGRFWI